MNKFDGAFETGESGDFFSTVTITNSGGITSSRNYLYHNDGNSFNWINIKCQGTTSKASAVGTRILLDTTINNIPHFQKHEIVSQNGHSGQNSFNAVLGLSNATSIDDIQFIWPSGLIETWSFVPINIDFHGK